MTLLGHIIRYDVRQFRLAIAIWLLVVGADFAIEGLQPLASRGLRAGLMLDIVGLLVVLARALMTVVIVPLIVQAHPLVGSDAFWLTRPVPPRILLASKLVLLGALVVGVPLAADLVLMTAYGVPADAMARTALQRVIWHSLLLALLMSGAVLTRNLARFAVLGGGALLSLAVVMAILSVLAMSSSDVQIVARTARSMAPLEPPDATAEFVWIVLLCGAGMVLVAVQYGSRRPTLAIAAGGAGAAFAFAAATAWPWPLLRPQLTVPAWAQSDSALKIAVDPASVRFNGGYTIGDGPSWELARAEGWLAPVAPSWLATVHLAHAALQLPDGTRITSRAHGYSAELPAVLKGEPSSSVAVRSLLGVERIIGPHPRVGESPVVFVMSDRDRIRLAGSEAAYTADFVVSLRQLSVAATLPLARGAVYQDGAYRVSIAGVRPQPESVSVDLRISDANTAFDRDAPTEYTFYVVNRADREAMEARISFETGSAAFIPFWYGVHIAVGSPWAGFRAWSQSATFPAYYDRGEGQAVDRDWFEAAEMVIVRSVLYGSVRRSVTFDRLRMPSR
jgi:hypothetical protein